MGQIDKTRKEIVKQATGLLSGRPIWIWWISYTVLVAFFFTLFYIAWSLLTERWWVITIIIIGAGMLWGTVMYFNQKPSSSGPASDE